MFFLLILIPHFSVFAHEIKLLVKKRKYFAGMIQFHLRFTLLILLYLYSYLKKLEIGIILSA